ncbi:GNAT family N-acetyltransferase [Actinomadura sp. B10D3]|uniref:GNAT family N-acetyltransferase n=1 Tax=Actinomadura sp. B10D3 TaxID=3153557 RepID=UPI00325EC9B2
MAHALSPFERDPRHVVQPRPYDHPDARWLTNELYLEQLARYDVADAPIDSVDDFAPPNGLFLIAYVDGVPCACGGIRTYEPGVAEIKKMYVAPAFRGHGLGRCILAALEQAGQANGVVRFILETGSRNTEALALYAHAGYYPIPAYRDRDSTINRALAKNATNPQ